MQLRQSTQDAELLLLIVKIIYLYTHIDFGKNKYGGPFTTEHAQVKDVKTFLRLLCLSIVGGILADAVITNSKSATILFKSAIYKPR